MRKNILNVVKVVSVAVVFLFPLLVLAQQADTMVVAGIVTDNQKTPLPGADIRVKGSTRGVTTDENGFFSIVVNRRDELLMSYIDYTTKSIIVVDTSFLNVVLEQNVGSLNDVVVIGYGTVKKSDLTGSVSSISSSDIRSVPVTTLDQAMQGKAAGVQITQMSGKPGAETSVRIRGTSSINAGNEPLYIVDGILINSDGVDISVGGTRGPRISPIASINPNDIESIEILKDASSTAMYGSRGTNGVVLITTKHGRVGKAVINLDVTYGLQEVGKKIKVLNAAEFAHFVNEAKLNAGKTPVYVNPKNLGAGTDWQSEIFRRAPVGNYQLGVMGGSEKIRYSLTGSYFNQKGIIINTDFKRYTVRSNLDWDISKRLSIGNTFSYSTINTSGVLTNAGQIVPGVVTGALLFNPVLPVFDSTVKGGYTFENDRGKVLGNPYAEAMEYNSVTKLSRVIGNVYAKYYILPCLQFKTTFGIDAFNNNESSYGPSFLKRAQASNGEASLGKTNGLTWLNENTLTFDKVFSQIHRVNAVGGFTMQQFNNEKLFVYAFDFPDDRTGYHNIATALKPQKPFNDESQWSMVSWLGRINYTLKDKYLFTLTGRADGSSKFAEGNKYGFFPSAAVAWRLSREKFLEQLTPINDWKLRASYGVLGNQAIASYSSLALIGPYGEGVFNSSLGSEVYTGQEPLSYPNRQLRWETTMQLDLGMDITLFDHRVTLTADYYKKKTNDLLLSTPIPLTSGFPSTLLNIGNIDNQGWDFTLQTINLKKKVAWSTNVNFSINKNKLTNLNSETDIILMGALLLRQDASIGTFYGYRFEGIFQSDDEAANSAVLPGQEQNSPNPASRARAGDRKYLDVNSDGKIDVEDRMILGNANPDFSFGITNNIRYKMFELNFFFQGSYGNKLANFNSYDLLNFTGENNVLAEAALNRWTPQNPSNKYPRALAAGSVDQGVFSSAIVEDASYLRLKSVNLSYYLPEKALRRMGISNLRLFLSGSNLLTFTKYSGYDPEANTFGQSTTLIGIDAGGYPQAKVYQLGISANF